MNPQSPSVSSLPVHVATPVRSADPKALRIVGNRFGIPVRAVEDLVTLRVEDLKHRDRFFAPSNAREIVAFPRFAPGAAKIPSYACDPSQAYVDYLREFDSATLVMSEAESGIKQHVTYQRYLKWTQEGHEPPYIHVNEGNDGNLISTNRRRLLAAQAAGVCIKGWFSPMNRESGNPLKYGDVLRAYDEALGTVAEYEEALATVC
ncbi:hypothetical protein [Paraburkholderia sp. J8-2]|uniref:hypothetical protein n=1 Tax=Paraburkholderia sp. J8-2 TaxID=2805440 RepID=UPI002AB71EB7|nr:hypothetical protein [Paraburkholderia sp. J8-2]